MHKNPFWRVKHPQRVAPATVNSAPPMMQQPPAPGYPPQQHQQMMYNNNNNPMMMPPQQQSNFSVATNSMGGPMMGQPGMNQTAIANASPDALYVFEGSQDVEGHVIITMPPGKKTEHLGIKLQFIGRIDMSVGIHEGKPHYDFVSLSKELAPPGVLYQQQTILPFRFKNMEKELESYRGRNVSVRYMVKFKMERKFVPPLKKEHDVWVQLLQQQPTRDEPIEMEVGIEDCLHITFKVSPLDGWYFFSFAHLLTHNLVRHCSQYSKRHYHLLDTIRGEIHFLLVRIKIKYMELAVLRRETSGEGVAAALAAGQQGGAQPPVNQGGSEGGNIFTETQTLIKYEIMDGAPVKGETIPVKLSLAGIPADLTPTFTAVNNRFSVRYFLNLVLVDEDDRRYFKQQEIILWRKDLGWAEAFSQLIPVAYVSMLLVPWFLLLARRE